MIVPANLPPAERIHHSSRSPEVRARAFASRGAARGAARDAGGEGPKKTSGPTDRACSHLEIFPTPARGIRVARGLNDAETPAGPHAEPKTDPSVPSIAKQSDQPTIGGGYNLLKRIRRVYAHDERPYHAFLAILIRFRNAEFTTEQVRAPAWFRRRKPRKRPRSNRPGVFSIVDGIREAASAARDRSRRPFPATPPAGPSWKLKKNHLERGAGQMGTASQHQQISDREKISLGSPFCCFPLCFLHLLRRRDFPTLTDAPRSIPNPDPIPRAGDQERRDAVLRPARLAARQGRP